MTTDSKNISQRLRQYGEFWAHPRTFCYSLAWLIVLVVVGTVAQRYVGLYQSQMKYFSSFFFWWGYVPLPGAYTALIFMFLGLVSQLIFKTRWVRDKLGINVTHIGGLLLLFGGFLTAMWSHEGNMVLTEGSIQNVVSDFHKVELAVRDSSPQDYDVITTFSQGFLNSGEVLKSTQLPFSLEVIKYYGNCDLVRRTGTAKRKYYGFAQRFDFASKALEKEDSKNQSCAMFRLQSGDPAVDGYYGVYESMPVQQTINIKNVTYTLELRHQQTVLPFQIELIDFEKKMYPGTQKAKSFKSVVNLIDGGAKQRIVIQMNEPLRYKDYTFYQASYIEGEDFEASVLAVVKNAGRLFPYISSITMCIGLLIHLLLQVPKLIKRRAV